MNVGVDDVHKLKSVVKREKAEVGILVCLNKPGGPMRREAESEGEVGPPSRKVLKLQIITVNDLFERHPIDLPGMIDPPEAVPSTPAFERPRRGKKKIEGQTEMLLALEGDAPAYKADTKRRGNRPIRVVDIEVTRAGSHKRTK